MTFQGLAGLRRRDFAAPPAVLLGIVCLGLAVFMVTLSGPHTTGDALKLTLAASFVLLVARYPVPSVVALIIWLPASMVVLAILFRLGVPIPVVRSMGAAKDVVAIGLIVSALRTRMPSRTDATDRFAYAYISLISLYLILPSALSGLLGSQPLHVRVLAWRQDVLFVVVFVALRRVEISPTWRRRVELAVVGAALLLAVCAYVEVTYPTGWNSFMEQRVQIDHYRFAVLGTLNPTPGTIIVKSSVGGVVFNRAGSLFLDAVVFPFYLLIAYGILIERATEASRPIRSICGAVALGIGIVLSLTRSAMLGAVAGTLAILLVGIKRKASGRVVIGAFLLAGAVAAVPVAHNTLVGARLADAANTHTEDTQGHIRGAKQGYVVAKDHPLGEGLGTVAGVGQRFAVNNTTVAENSYLQVADETGIATMIVFIGMLVSVVRRLRREDPLARQRSLAIGLMGAGVALGVSGLFLHVWLDYATSITFWAVCAIAVPHTRSASDE